MPDHPPPSFASDEPPHLDSRDVRAPIDPGDALHEQIETARAIKAVAHDAGYRSGYEAGRRDAQTEIDAATAEHARTEERARCTEHVEALLLIAFEGRVSLADVDKARAAIRSGKPAPK